MAAETQENKDNGADVDTVVYTWGTGRSGELGHDKLDKSQQCLLPTPVTYFSKNKIKISYIACGEGYSCAISSSKQLYTWGMHYKLGIGPSKDGSEKMQAPVLVQYFVDQKELIEKVACGECHMAAISHSHKLYLWGKSENGCIGDKNGKKHDVLLPYHLSLDFLQNEQLYPVEVDLGWKTSAFILNDGSVYSFGCATNKVLGHKNTDKNYLKPTKITFPVAVDDENESKSEQVKMVQLSMGSHHAACVSDSGDVYIWGNNSWYNLGLGNNKNKASYCTPQLLSKEKCFNGEKVVSVSCTKSMINPVKGPGKEGLHTMAVTENGHCWSWGAGHKGKCANLNEKWGFHLSGKEDIKRPYCVGGKAYDAEKKENTDYFKNVKIVQCVASAIHSGVVSEDGGAYTFGCGSDGRMGLKAYVEGSCGAGKQVFKFYVSKPTRIEVLHDGKVAVKQIGSARRHMVALGHVTRDHAL